MMGDDLLIVIPARGGSKRIKDKNCYLLCGKPLLIYATEVAIAADVSSHIVVSSESKKILNLASSAGVSVLERPVALAQDESSTESVLLHALEEYEKRGKVFNWIMTLQPTSPFRTAKAIQKCVQLLDGLDDSVDCVMTVTEDKGDYWLKNDDDTLNRLFPNAPRRQQDRRPLYQENSAVYITRVTALRQFNSILGRKVVGVPINQREALDINTTEDLELAEGLLL